MGWPRDDAKLERVRALMAEEELDALVVRAPDNVLYLTNFWGMKGYDAVVFPQEGEPTLICLEASAGDAERTAWTTDVRLFPGYDEPDPRPPQRARARRSRVEAAQGLRDGSALELSLGTQASDRMVGEPTTYTRAWFDAWPDAADATPLLARARAIKTEQELERMRLANEIAAAAMEYVARPAAARHEGERGGGALERLRPRPRDGLGGQGRARAAASRSSGRAPGSGRSRRPATGRCRSTSRRCSRSGSAPTATGATTRRTSAPAS